MPRLQHYNSFLTLSTHRSNPVGGFNCVGYNELMIDRNDIHHSAMLRPDISKGKQYAKQLKKNLKAVDKSKKRIKIEVKTED